MKHECVNHVGKRLGSRLRKLANQFNLGGKNGLTFAFIKTVQSYFTNAIVRNSNNVARMKEDILAIFHHYLSDDEDPQHYYCPGDVNTWCVYNRAINENTLEDFRHNVKVRYDVWIRTKDIFYELANNNQLLRRCQNGYRQNVNESFNNLIWIRCPKTIYRSIDSIKVGMLDAVICMNDNYSARLKVLEHLKLDYSIKTIDNFERLDQIQSSNRQREKSRSQKKILEHLTDVNEADDDDLDLDYDYQPGSDL